MKKSLFYLGIAVAIGILSSGSVIAQVNPAPVEEMVIPYISDPITMDGILDDAYSPVFKLMNMITDPDYPGKYTGAADHQVYVTLGWRDEGIYVFFDIVDDIDLGSPIDWQVDGVEFKINPDITNDDAAFSYMDDGLEIGISRGVDTVYRFHNPAINAPDGSGGSDVIGDTCTTAHKSGKPDLDIAIVNEEGKYTVEVLLPWLFILPNDATEDSIANWRSREMGFDIHCADKDDSDKRDHVFVWDADGSGWDADGANKNTSLMGKITFGERTSGIYNTINNSGSLLVYPNPASDVVYLDELSDVSTVEFISLLGQTVKTVYITSSELLKIDISDLPASSYLIRGIDVNGDLVSINKLLIVK